MTKHRKDEKIRRLSDREQAREKISIFFGSADNFVHPIKEVIANSTDEIINNFDSGKVSVELLDDMQTIIIKDTGRGVPINGKTDGTDNYELLLLTLFAGTKYGEGGKMDGSYTGSNGVGLTTVNYTSSVFEVESTYNGKTHSIGFANGGEIVKPLTSTNADKDLHGTTIKFKLDSDVYTNTVYQVDEIKEIVKHYAVGSNKVELSFIYDGETTKYHYDNLLDYYEEMIGDTATSASAFGQSKLFDDSGEKTEISIALSTTTEVFQESYLNLTFLPQGGKINEGIINGVKLYANSYCRANNLFPKKVKSFSNIDIENSISFASIMFSNRVEFENQTKLSTQKNLYKEVAQKRVKEIMDVMEVENFKEFEKFINHLLLVQKENTSNQKQKEKLKKKLREKVDNMANSIDKFVDCEIHGEEAELYLAEGDSAHGSVVLARDGTFQASMPMGGKFLNVEKVNDPDNIINNDIVMNVVKVLGCGIDLGKKYKDVAQFDISRMRYGKVICASDEDADGAQITALIITLFNKLMPEVIRQGRLYVAKTPLYEVRLKDDSVLYVYTDEERDKAIKKHKKNMVNIARSKGLGELNAEVMAQTAMNPETRHLVKVTVKDIEKAQQAIDDWMGSDTANRKEFISENLNKYIGEAIND